MSLPDTTTYSGDSVIMTLQFAPSSAAAAPDVCSPSSYCPRFRWRKEAPWDMYDKFVPIYADFGLGWDPDLQTYFMYSSVQGGVADPLSDGRVYELSPPCRYDVVNGWPQIWDAEQWTWKLTVNSKVDVLARMAEPDYRNFFFEGHGAPDFIGGIPRDGQRLNRIYRKDIMEALGNARTWGKNDHPYRFVMLYCCQGAKGNLCRAFGIPRKEGLTVKDFVDHGLRARAFIGSDTEPSSEIGGVSSDERLLAEKEQEAIERLFKEWRKGRRLDEILGDAYTIVNGNEVKRLGIDPSYKILGAFDLTVDGR